MERGGGGQNKTHKQKWGKGYEGWRIGGVGIGVGDGIWGRGDKGWRIGGVGKGRGNERWD